MKKALTLILIFVLALMLAACGSREKRKTAYIRASETKALDVPTDMDPPRTDTAVIIAVPANELPRVEDEPESTLPPLILNFGQLENSNVSIGYSAHGTYLVLKDTLNSTYRRLGLTLPRIGVTNIEAFDSEHAYAFDYVHKRLHYKKSFWEKMKFWQDNKGPDYSGRYRLELKQAKRATRVYLMDVNGAPIEADAAGVIFAVFLERLG